MATYSERITAPRCNEMLAACSGLRVSHAWRSFPPCIFLELGRLSKSYRTKNAHGQVTFMLECDWRIEKARSIQVGSGFSELTINGHLKKILGVEIQSVEVLGSVPEIHLKLADGRRLYTFTNWKSHPQWRIGFKDGSLLPLSERWSGIDVTPWIHAGPGRIEIEYCYDDRKPASKRT